MKGSLEAGGDIPMARGRWPTLLAGLILLAGAALRVRAFAAPLSLWGDELAAAIHLLGLPHDPIIEGWVAHQPAPLGFRALTRLAVGALGVSEASLRLVPFLASLASLPLFAWLATRWAGPQRALLPLLVFAVNPFLVRYAAEFKPYSLDVLVACALLALAVVAPDAPRARRALLPVGVLAVWLSFPSVFVLASVAALELMAAGASRDRAALRGALLRALLWSISFVASFLLVARTAAASPWLLHFWRARPGFWPLVPPSLESLWWPFERVVALSADPGGFGEGAVAAAGIFLVGGAALLLRRRPRAALLLGPLALAMVASALEKYPVYGRLMLFYCPMLALGLGEGARRATEASSRPWVRAGVALALAVLLAAPVSSSLSGFLQPRSISDARPVLEFVAARRQAGDVLYAFPYALPAIAYYGPCVELGDVPVVTALRQGGAPDPLAHTFEKIRPGARVWFIMTQVPEFDFTENEREILAALDARGRRLGTFRAMGATAYLYQL